MSSVSFLEDSPMVSSNPTITTKVKTPKVNTSKVSKKSESSNIWFWVILIIIILGCGYYFYKINQKNYICVNKQCKKVNKGEEGTGKYSSSNCDNECTPNPTPDNSYNCVNNKCERSPDGTPGEYASLQICLESECGNSGGGGGGGLNYHCTGDNICSVVTCNLNTDDNCYIDKTCDGNCDPPPEPDLCEGRFIKNCDDDLQCSYATYEITQKFTGDTSVSNPGCSEILGKTTINKDNLSRGSAVTLNDIRTYDVGDEIHVECGVEQCKKNNSDQINNRYICKEKQCSLRGIDENWNETPLTYNNLIDCEASNCKYSGGYKWFIYKGDDSRVEDNLNNNDDNYLDRNDERCGYCNKEHTAKCLNNIDNPDEEKNINGWLQHPINYDSEEECNNALNVENNSDYLGTYVRRLVTQGDYRINGRIEPTIKPYCALYKDAKLSDLYNNPTRDFEKERITQECTDYVENLLNDVKSRINNKIIKNNKMIYDKYCNIENGVENPLPGCPVGSPELITEIEDEVKIPNQSNPDIPPPDDKTIQNYNSLINKIENIPNIICYHKDANDNEKILTGIPCEDEYESWKNEKKNIEDDLNNMKMGSQYQCIPSNIEERDISQFRDVWNIKEELNDKTKKEIYNEKILHTLKRCEDSLYNSNGVKSDGLYGGDYLSNWRTFTGSKNTPISLEDVHNKTNGNPNNWSSEENILKPDKCNSKDICNCNVFYPGPNNLCGTSCLIDEQNEWIPEDCSIFSDIEGSQNSNITPTCGKEARNTILGGEINLPKNCLDNDGDEHKAWMPSQISDFGNKTENTDDGVEIDDSNYCLGTEYVNYRMFINSRPEAGEGPRKCVFRKINEFDIQRSRDVNINQWIYKPSDYEPKYNDGGYENAKIACENSWQCGPVQAAQCNSWKNCASGTRCAKENNIPEPHPNGKDQITGIVPIDNRPFIQGERAYDVFMERSCCGGRGGDCVKCCDRYVYNPNHKNCWETDNSGSDTRCINPDVSPSTGYGMHNPPFPGSRIENN